MFNLKYAEALTIHIHGLKWQIWMDFVLSA
jgi:hypothetical protein